MTRRWNYRKDSLRKEISRLRKQMKAISDRHKTEDVLKEMRRKQPLTIRPYSRFGRFF